MKKCEKNSFWELLDKRTDEQQAEEDGCSGGRGPALQPCFLLRDPGTGWRSAEAKVSKVLKARKVPKVTKPTVLTAPPKDNKEWQYGGDWEGDTFGMGRPEDGMDDWGMAWPSPSSPQSSHDSVNLNLDDLLKDMREVVSPRCCVYGPLVSRVLSIVLDYGHTTRGRTQQRLPDSEFTGLVATDHAR